MQAPGGILERQSAYNVMARINQSNSSSMNVNVKIEFISSIPTLSQRMAANPCIDAPTFFDIAQNILQLQ